MMPHYLRRAGRPLALGLLATGLAACLPLVNVTPAAPPDTRPALNFYKSPPWSRLMVDDIEVGDPALFSDYDRPLHVEPGRHHFLIRSNHAVLWQQDLTMKTGDHLEITVPELRAAP